jgi:glycosyltransferase involved in cell wall biosynthesis
LGLTNSLVCIPAVADALLGEAYARAALFVYPSLSEGFGIPPLEAMAADCPVAASNVTAIPEICRDAPFYFDPYDVGSIARAMLAGVADGVDRSSAITKGKLVAAGYSWEKCGAMTLAAYRECQ